MTGEPNSIHNAMNSKTQFSTKGGYTTDVQTIKAANVKSEQALFDLRYQLGIFAIYCEENKLKVKEQAAKLGSKGSLLSSPDNGFQSFIRDTIWLVFTDGFPVEHGIDDWIVYHKRLLMRSKPRIVLITQVSLI